ncbi:hypothetical protein K437DRAFT_231915 [Tilletiaria anomala UBC 951]|uniref:Mitochondrial chaperone BCS1 n=1 Tax=Tilletiaria anomala (strain ATCC 24038 / CBS 436.72 / UBC 951) TaxID=1037660 RepID=A0A066WNK4_TILAU|nr:uncharacterized protein K437DRAFT_231915 [Tilletiaria anomala UBC 951]KDN52584.1 hypothetical protein K437DRAFT_231915 [Tilletiaria anomala UBC 951]
MQSMAPSQAASGQAGGFDKASPGVEPRIDPSSATSSGTSAKGTTKGLGPSSSNVGEPCTDINGSTISALLPASISENPYFSAGFGLMIFGAALGIARKSITVGAAGVQRRMLVSLEITSKDRAYPWFLYWMGKQAEAASLREVGLLPPLPREGVLQLAGITRPPLYNASSADASKRSDKVIQVEGAENPLALSEETSLQPVRIFSHELSVETSAVQNVYGQDHRGGATTFTLIPGPGTHFFRYHGTWMRMQRERAERMTDLNSGRPFETVKLSTLRSASWVFPKLLNEARKLAMNATQGKTTVYTSWSVEWRPFGKPLRPRELSSVVLAKGTKEMLVHDIRHFLERGKWYAERGIPYRRGYLLHGAPGSGKTSFIMALAGYLDYNICLLNLSERGMTDDRLTHLMTNAPERSIILLEDIDAAFTGRQTAAEDGYQANVTFSGLLNALDGVASGESRIVFMTTNHADQLDPALIRPGRADVIVELGDAESEQVRRLVTRFYRRTGEVPIADSPEASGQLPDEEIDKLAGQLAELVDRESQRRRAVLGLDPSGRQRLAKGDRDASKDASQQMRQTIGPDPAASGGVSMAELQGLFIRFPEDPKAAIAAFKVESVERGNHIGKRA